MATETRRRRVAKSPEDRRSDLLRAGHAVFGDIGFAEAKVADITDAAGIAKGTFYLHFESKDHLLAALWEEYVNAIVATAETILGAHPAAPEGPDDWWRTNDRLLTALVEHSIRNAELHRVVYGSANAKALELCAVSNARVVDLLCAFVARGGEAGVFAALDLDLACRALYHGIHGLLGDVIARRTPIDTAAITASVLELAHRALAAPPALPAVKRHAV